jgi:ribosome maturation factor RimP
MEIADEIRKIAQSKLTNQHHFIVDVILSARSGPKKVLIIIDGDEGITIDDCADISREVSKALDETPILSDNYLLEVSTPGTDYPLKLKRQYKKHIGRKLRVKLPDKTVEGKLQDVTEEEIIVAEEIGTGKKKTINIININFSQIDKAFVLVSFK